MDPFADDDDNYSIDLENKAVLREKQARSEALDQVVEFSQLEKQRMLRPKKRNCKFCV